MMKYKFRGKRKDNGGWVYGSLVHQTNYYGDVCDKYYIVDGTSCPVDDVLGEEYEVIPETVGQFTGLHDKNSVGIYNGDILEVNFNDDCCNIGKQKAVIKYSEKHTAFLMKPIDNWAFCEMSDGKVIGNIHDKEEVR